jgi:hypothetical protein
MGAIYGRYDSYALGLAALAVVALGALLLTVTVVAHATGPASAVESGNSVTREGTTGRV